MWRVVHHLRGVLKFNSTDEKMTFWLVIERFGRGGAGEMEKIFSLPCWRCCGGFWMMLTLSGRLGSGWRPGESFFSVSLRTRALHSYDALDVARTCYCFPPQEDWQWRPQTLVSEEGCKWMQVQTVWTIQAEGIRVLLSDKHGRCETEQNCRCSPQIDIPDFVEEFEVWSFITWVIRKTQISESLHFLATINQYRLAASSTGHFCNEANLLEKWPYRKCSYTVFLHFMLHQWSLGTVWKTSWHIFSQIIIYFRWG